MEEIMALLRGSDDARRTRRTFSRLGWALAILLVLQVAGQYLLLRVMGRVAPIWLSGPTANIILAAVASYGLAFPVAMLLMRGLPAERPSARGSLSAPQGLSLWAVTMGAVYGTNLITLQLLEAVETMRGAPIYNPVELLTEQPVLVNLLLSCVLAPIIEELLFRRVLIDRLRPWGEGFALVASAIVFALVHANLYQMLYALVVGLILGGLYLHTGRVSHTILLHAAVNAVSAGISPLALRFGDMGEVFMTVLILGSMGWCGAWLFFQGAALVKGAKALGWGDGATWGQFVVNSGMTAFCLLLLAMVWVSTF